MPSSAPSLAALHLPAAPGTVSAVVSVVAGVALLLALHARRWPNWLRADCAVASVGLYAIAFAYIGVIGEDAAWQTVAYGLGFVLASMLEPLAARRSRPEGLDAAEERDPGGSGP